MPFSYDPHQQAKIWLSQDSATFLFRENRKRFLKIRYNLPNDILHLIYDSTLLNDAAREELEGFCAKYQIVPKDIADLVTTSENEEALLALYRLEAGQLQSGGNPGAASDILRWMYDVYTLGIYSDFDLYVNTRGLPKTMSTRSPILFNLQTLDSSYLYSNDAIGIVDPEAAKNIIRYIQQRIIDNYNNKNIFKHLPTQYIANNILHRLRKSGLSIPEVRDRIQKYYADNQSYCEFREKDIHQIAHEVRNQNLGWENSILALFNEECASMKAIAQIKDDEILVTKLREQERFLLLRATVLYVSGPGILASILDSAPAHMAFDQHEIKIERLVNKHLGSRISSFFTKNKEVTNDISWLAEGQQVAQLKANKINIKAENLRQDLPHQFLELKKRIEQQLLKLENPQPNNSYLSCFFPIQSTQPIAKTEQLKNVLNCFYNNDFFNIKAFCELRHDLHLIQSYSPETQALIAQLDKLCQKAIIYEIADDIIELPANHPQEDLSSINSPLIRHEG